MSLQAVKNFLYQRGKAIAQPVALAAGAVWQVLPPSTKPIALGLGIGSIVGSQIKAASFIGKLIEKQGFTEESPASYLPYAMLASCFALDFFLSLKIAKYVVSDPIHPPMPITHARRSATNNPIQR